MRAVLDTNVFLSAMLSARGAPARIVDAWQAKRFELVTSLAQIEEFRWAVRYDRLRPYVPRGTAGRIVNKLRTGQVLRHPRAGVDAPDPGDTYLVATAIVSGADFLVTGDKGLLAMKRIGTTRVISAGRFAAMFER